MSVDDCGRGICLCPTDVVFPSSVEPEVSPLDAFVAYLSKLSIEERRAVISTFNDSPTCETCGRLVREGLRFCSGLSECWRRGVGLSDQKPATGF